MRIYAQDTEKPEKVDAEVEVRQYQYAVLLVRETKVPLVSAIGVAHDSKLLTLSDHPVGTENVGVTPTPTPGAESNASLPAPPVAVQE